MAPDGDKEPLDEQLRRACCELIDEIQSGGPGRSEAVLSRYPALANNVDCALEVILTEYKTRAELGQPSGPGTWEEWYTRFSQWHDGLQRLFLVYQETIAEATTMARPNMAAQTTIGSDGLPAYDWQPIRIGRYEVVEELGRGAMEVVYKVRDLELGRIVALKTFRSGVPDENSRKRFQRQMKAVALLDHPHIIPLYEIGEHEGCPYFTMKWAPGGSLSQHRERLLGDPPSVVSLMEKVARAVHYAHQNGILHRDLKPGNILLDEHNEPLVSDFGLAKLIEVSEELSYSGLVIGTIPYMPPEQAAGRIHEVAAVSEVWSLGVIIYELLTGSRPFVGDNPEEIINRIQTEVPQPPQVVRPELDPALAAIAMQCLEKDPGCRYPSAEALANALGCWLRGEPPPPARSWLWRLWRRAGRAMEGHAAWQAACLVLLLVAPVSVWILHRALASVPDQIRSLEEERQDEHKKHLEAALQLLAAGFKVTLIGERGQPLWSSLRTEESAFRLHITTDLPMAAEVGNHFVLLELLPHVPCSAYHIRAEVQYDRALGHGHMGIYCAYRGEKDVDQARHHYFFALDFNEAGSGPQAPPKPGPGFFRANLGLWHYLERNPGPLRSDNHGIDHQKVARYPIGNKPWRKLGIVITPKQVEANWEDQPLGQGRWTWAELAERDELKQFVPLVDRQGGLGLFVIGSQAYVRNVTVEPLTPP
jgi:hypothetical protein